MGAGLLLLLALGAAFWVWQRPRPLQTISPRIGPAVVAVYASGTVEASIMLPVAPRLGARLVSLNRDEHSQVRKGEILGRLEAVDVNSNTAVLEANAAFAKRDYERDARLLAENAVARQIYDRALADWQAADAAVRQARAQAGYMTLRAPDDCVVIQRDGEIGQFIAANAPVFWLSCHAPLRISALVDEEDISLVKPGQQVLIRADAFPGKIFHARVTEVTPKGDPIGRSYRVRIELPRDTPLQIGMTTESNIVIRETSRALLLPSASVVDGQVWKRVGDRFVHTPVVTGARTNDTAEILSGLGPDDVVLRDGAAGAKP